MPRNQKRGGSRGNNNNPQGRNQFSGNGWMDMARERPAAAAAVAAGAAAAGVFLWSKRGQISEQLSNISDQLGEWTENRMSEGNREFETAGGDSFSGSATSGSTAGTGASATGGSGRTGSVGTSGTPRGASSGVGSASPNPSPSPSSSPSGGGRGRA